VFIFQVISSLQVLQLKYLWASSCCILHVLPISSSFVFNNRKWIGLILPEGQCYINLDLESTDSNSYSSPRSVLLSIKIKAELTHGKCNRLRPVNSSSSPSSTLYHMKFPCHHGLGLERPLVWGGGDCLQIWRVAMNIMNKQSQTAMGSRRARNSSLYKTITLQNVIQNLGFQWLAELLYILKDCDPLN
jgi:hypothetical protein